MSEIKTPWKKLQNKDYLGECDFQPGEEKTVTIASITTRHMFSGNHLKIFRADLLDACGVKGDA